MKIPKIWPLALLSLCAAYACSESPTDDKNEDQLIMQKGSVDHAAVVEVTTMMLFNGPTDLGTIIDAYNQDDPFAIRGKPYASSFAKKLSQFDEYDDKEDWTPEQAAKWVSRVSTGNYLVVDTSKPCDYDSPHTYLEIERAQMTGKPHETCGGRMPNEDAFDVTVNWLIRGPSASVDDEDAIGDGVDHATRPSVATFPYLAELNGI